MNFWRLFKNSVKFAFRAKKRWITFVIIFALLSAFITFFVSTFNGYNTENLIEYKGFYLKESSSHSVTEVQGKNFAANITELPQVENVTLFRYFDLGSYIRVFSVDPAARWMFDDAKPSLLSTGRYIMFKNEALISYGATIHADLGGLSSSVNATLHRGESLIFGNGAENVTISIVGEIHDKIFAPSKLKLFLNDETFDYIQQNFSDNATVYCYSLTVLVKGDMYNPFSSDLYNNIKALSSQDNIIYIDPTDTEQTSKFGTWTVYYTPEAIRTKKAVATDFLYFVSGIAGGITLVLLYNALIVWFRKREIAVLRAMGYSKGEIRINLVGESITISFIGFIVGISIMLIYFWTQNMTFTNQVITPFTILISFGIVVVLAIPGLLITSVSFTKVNPILLFKGR